MAHGITVKLNRMRFRRTKPRPARRRDRSLAGKARVRARKAEQRRAPNRWSA